MQLWVAIGIGVLLGLWIGRHRRHLATFWCGWRVRQRRKLVEDALKALLAETLDGREPNGAQLRAALGISEVRLSGLLAEMAERGLLQLAGDSIRLTETGRQWAAHVLRAHRLWERYLADEARMALDAVHPAADRAEHRLDEQRLEQLEAHLGYPSVDPHGDLIPRSDGTVDGRTAYQLTEWEINRKARIVHIEDEPPGAFRQLLAAGLRPGKTIQLIGRSDQELVIRDSTEVRSLPASLARNVHVEPAEQVPELPPNAMPLSSLARGTTARIVTLDSEFQGFARRRLLDLGFTPGARVAVALDNVFGDPRAYLVRGTLIALRSDHASHIWVVPEGEVSGAESHGKGRTTGLIDTE